MFSFLSNHGESVAVHHQRGSLSYRQLNRLLAMAVAELDGLGLAPGERLAVSLSNSLELLLAYYACLLRGVVMVPINDGLAVAEAGRVLAHAEPRGLITTRKILPRRRLPGGHDPSRTLLWEDLHRRVDDGDGSPGSLEPPDWPAEAPAILFYTSGSTGRPKGALFTHRTVRETTRIYKKHLKLGPEDGSILVHSQSHNWVFTLKTTPFLAAGGTVNIVDFGSVEQTMEALRRGATFLACIPWFGFELVDFAERHGHPEHHLRVCWVGGDRVPPDFFERFQGAFGVMPAQLLGMAEMNTYVVNPLREGDLRLASVGTPLEGCLVEVRDATGRPVPTGEEGEIWVRTSMAMAEYWRDPEGTQRALRDGWFATGDAGHLDAEGYLWFHSRIKHIIICDGDNIHPAMVEDELRRHPSVNGAIVVGVPHPTRGELVAAALTLHPGAHSLTRAAVAEFLRDRLTSNETPQVLLVVQAFPETPTGKIDRLALAEALRTRASALESPC